MLLKVGHWRSFYIHIVSESVLYVYEGYAEENTMADSGIDRISTTKVISPIQGDDRGAGSLHEEAGHLGRDRALSVGWGRGKKEGGEQKGSQPTTLTVIEQWICLVWGFICMAFGVWGIFVKPRQDALYEHIAWLGSLYMPTLRVMAIVCIGLGVMLVRRGWAHL
jgi:hypothetical protein